MLNSPPTRTWREELETFLRRTVDEDKLEIAPRSVAALEKLIEARVGSAGGRGGARSPAGASPYAVAAASTTEASRQPANARADAAPPRRSVAPRGRPTGQSHFADGQQLFEQRLASAKRHFDVLDQLVRVAGDKIDAAKPGEETDVGYEAMMAGKHLHLYNDDLIAARDTWLRYNLRPEAMSQMYGMLTPVALGLPACADPAQESRQREQTTEIGRRLAREGASLDAQATALSAIDVAANAASLVVGAGILVGVARKAGTWAVVKTVVVGYAIYMDTKIAETVAQNAGLSEQAIQGAELAAAVITLILLHKIPKEPIPESPPPKGCPAGQPSRAPHHLAPGNRQCRPFRACRRPRPGML